MKIKTVIVEPGDTLSHIAEATTGRASDWVRLAKFNRLTDPHDITPGQVIAIPE